MKRDLKFEWFYPHNAEHVWECLTTSELIAQWLMANDFKLQLGHKFQFRAKPMPGWCGIVDCEIKEIVPNKKLTYTWASGAKPGSNEINTVVTWHLQPENGGTRLVLEHKGFTGFKAWMTSFLLGSGWKGHIAKAFTNVLNQTAAAHESKV
jgi:uncharacterized protein YndB with AHSA1/START domain